VILALMFHLLLKSPTKAGCSFAPNRTRGSASDCVVSDSYALSVTA